MADFLKDFQEKKRKVEELVTRAASLGVISTSEKDEIIGKINSSKLTIGVIGQMKAGKSTFLNTFIFKDKVLPSAITTMTAALSVITYGEKKEIEVEFYSEDDWAEQKRNSELDESGTDDEKVKVAKELVENVRKSGLNVDSYLGKKNKDSLDNLIQYVGVNGKFTPIVKSVKIFYPLDYLKGVEIVDTPGLNDPIASREQRTKDFLKEADAVLLMTSGTKIFDTNDQSILFDSVRQCGTGKVLIGINKYDEVQKDFEKERSAISLEGYVINQIKEKSKEYRDSTFIELLDSVKPVCISAYMSLLSEMPESHMDSDDKEHLADYLDVWIDRGGRTELKALSHIEELEEQVKKLCEDSEKFRIILAKPTTRIMEGLAVKISENEVNITTLENQYKILASEEDSSKKLKDLNRAKERVERQLDENHLPSRLKSAAKLVLCDTRSDIVNAFNDTCKKLTRYIDEDFKLQKTFEDVRSEFDRKFNDLTVFDLPRIVREQESVLENKFLDEVTETINKINDKLSSKLGDYDLDDYGETTKNQVVINFGSENLFNQKNIFSKIEGAKAKIPFYSKVSLKNDLKNEIENLRTESYKESLKTFEEAVDSEIIRIVNKIRDITISDLIQPLIEDIEECEKDASAREKILNENREKLEVLKSENEKLKSNEKQLRSML